MSDEIPVWVRLALKRWGSQKRRIWLGRDWYGNIDGYAQSLLGRIRDEREGSSYGVLAQKWPEVYRGDGLEVQRALQGIAEKLHAVLHLQYVWDPAWKVAPRDKARLIDLSRSEYFAIRNRAETWIHAKLESGLPETKLQQLSRKIASTLLQSA
jgi:hypothetical protein